MTLIDFWHGVWPAFWFGMGGAWVGYWSCVWVHQRILRRRAQQLSAQMLVAQRTVEIPRIRTHLNLPPMRRNLHIHTGFDHDD